MDSLDSQLRFALEAGRLKSVLRQGFLGDSSRRYQNGGGSWRPHGITADQVLGKAALIEDGPATLGEYARSLIGDAVSRGYLAPASGS